MRICGRLSSSSTLQTTSVHVSPISHLPAPLRGPATGFSAFWSVHGGALQRLCWRTSSLLGILQKVSVASDRGVQISTTYVFRVSHDCGRRAMASDGWLFAGFTRVVAASTSKWTVGFGAWQDLAHRAAFPASHGLADGCMPQAYIYQECQDHTFAAVEYAS